MSRALVPLLMTAMSAATGCAPSGNDPRSQLSTYEPPTGEYRLRYLEPPWEIVEQDGSSVRARVPSLLSSRDAGAGVFELSVSVESGRAEARARADVAAARSRGDAIVVDVRAVETLDGASGWELVTVSGADPLEAHQRWAYFPQGSRVVRLHFVADQPLDTPELDAMVRAFEVP